MSDRFQHIIPQCIGSACVAFLTQMETVQGHVAEVSVSARSVRKRKVHNERLEHHTKVGLVVEFLSVCNVHLEMIPFLDQFYVPFLFPAETRRQEAGTFDHVHRDTLLWFPFEPS